MNAKYENVTIDRDEALEYAKLRGHKQKVARAREIIKEALAVDLKPYIAFSTGKDSTCLLHLVLEEAPDTPVVYFDADCALPESIQLLDRYEQDGINILRWKTPPLLETYAKYGIDHPNIGALSLWTTVYEPIAQLIDKFGYEGCFLGLRASESQARKDIIVARGEIYFTKAKNIVQILPIAWWKDHDVWAYIHSHNLPYNRAYDLDGVTRTSYWAGTTNITHGRFVELKRHWPELFNKFAKMFPEITTKT